MKGRATAAIRRGARAVRSTPAENGTGDACYPAGRKASATELDQAQAPTAVVNR